MFALGIASYRPEIVIQIVYAMCAIATNSPSAPLRDAALLLPKNRWLRLSSGYALRLDMIIDIADRHCVSFESSPQARLARLTGETQEEAIRRRQGVYRSLKNRQCQLLATRLFEQWPASVAVMPTAFDTTYSLIHEEDFKAKASALFSTIFLNRRLFQHAEQLQLAFDQIPHRPPVPVIHMVPETPAMIRPCPTYVPITLLDLVRNNDRLASARLHPLTAAASLGEASSVSRLTSSMSESVLPNTSTPRSSTRELVEQLLERNHGGLSARYIRDLSQCVDALETQSNPLVRRVQNALGPRNHPEDVLFFAGLWPSRGPESLLSLLSLHLRQEVHSDWKTTLVGCAESLAAIQRDRRIATFKFLGLEPERVKEFENPGGQGWEAVEYPDWLLIQLDANFLIRPVQTSIAHEMMSPKSQQNTVMQLNMGEGKSSVSMITFCLSFC
jgi:Protein of unknown function (DUF3638)